MIRKLLKRGVVYNTSDLLQIQGNDDESQLSESTSTINIDIELFPANVIDHFDGIYAHRSHKRCINYTYLTLLCLTFSVIFWMIYWMTYEYCEKSLSFEENSLICKTVFLCQILTIISLGLCPIFFLLMIIFWCIFSCQNPIDRIRNNFIGFRLEGNQWENQLNFYFKNKKTCCKFYSNRQYKKLLDRNFGYIILSSHGIIFDELFILTSNKNICLSGILINNGQILKLDFKKIFSIYEIFIYLPNELINQENLKELNKVLKIKINIDTILPVQF